MQCEGCKRRRSWDKFRSVRGHKLRICKDCEDLTWAEVEARSKARAIAMAEYLKEG